MLVCPKSHPQGRVREETSGRAGQGPNGSAEGRGGLQSCHGVASSKSLCLSEPRSLRLWNAGVGSVGKPHQAGMCSHGRPPTAPVSGGEACPAGGKPKCQWLHHVWTLLRPHGPQSAGLPRLWDSPGKNPVTRGHFPSPGEPSRPRD